MGMNNLEGKSILFATFSMWDKGKRMPTNGNLEPLRDYLLTKGIYKLTLIDQPVPSSQIVMPVVEQYLGNKRNFGVERLSRWLYILLPLLKLFNKHGTRMIFKLRDLLSVLDIAFQTREKYDYLIGVEFVNCIAGILLRRLGRVQKVIYYVLDFSPNRYSNKFINSIYLRLDRFCAYNADYVWDVSKEFQKVRIEKGLNPKLCAPIIHVPIGLYNYQIINNKLKLRIKYSLVFVGTLGEENGPDLAIKTLTKLQNKYPNISLHIIGGGVRNIERLKNLCDKLNISYKVKFYGYVESIREMAKIIKGFDIALAPYRKMPGSIRYYADSAKIRTYAGVGLPIITTDVPPLGRELAKLGGAIIADDNETSFAQAIDRLYSNKTLYLKMQKKVRQFSRNNTWENEFNNAFSGMAS